MHALRTRPARRAGLAVLSAAAVLAIAIAQPVGAAAGRSETAGIDGPVAPVAGAAPTYDWGASNAEEPQRLITSTPLAISGGGDIVMDDAHQRIYMSGDDRVLVLDLAGNVTQTLTGHSGASSMVLAGNVLYVLETSSVTAIDVSATPTNGGTVASGLQTPNGLAYAGGALFTAVGPCVASSATGTAAILRIDLFGVTPATFPGTGLSDLRCPALDAKGNDLVVGDSGPVATLSRWNVAGFTPTPITSTTITGSTSVMQVAIDQPTSTVTVALGAAQPSQTRSLSTLALTASYAAAPAYSSAASAARGGMVVLGGWYSPNVMLYKRGTAAPMWTLTLNDLVLDVDFDGAGNRVYAFVLEIDASGNALPRLVVIDIDDPKYPGSSDGEFHALDPKRVYDSRATGQRVTQTTVRMTGAGGVPATNVSAVAVNITVTDAVGEGYVSVYPSGSARPNASTLNFRAGMSVPNMAIVGLGPDGGLSVFASAPAHVIVDVVGWFGDAGAAGGSRFHAITPARWFDTRTMKRGDGTIRPVGAAQGINVAFTGLPITSSHISAAALNVTATNTTSESYLTVTPYGGALGSSNLNWKAHEVVPNAVISRLDAQFGALSFVNAFGSTDVIADSTGYWDDGTVATGARFHPVQPTRLADTRTGYLAAGSLAGSATRIEAGGFIAFKANGTLPPGATSAVLNVTAVSPGAPGYLSVYPRGLDPVQGSRTSLVNFAPGDVRPNMSIMPIGAGGEIVVVNNSAGPIDVIADITGYFA